VPRGNVRLLAAVDPTLALAAEVVVAPLALDYAFVERSEPVEFSYFTPLSTPAVNGARSTCQDIGVDVDVTLVFRMIERGNLRIRSRHVVLDPQQPRDLEQLDLDWIDADHVALVLNRAEAGALSLMALATEADITEAARRLLSTYNVELVVIKLGAQGAAVGTATGVDRVGAFPTPSLLTALSDPTRQRVVQLLSEGPRRAGELAAASGTSAPTMSRHLRVLLMAGIVADERRADSQSR
jgi:hypothetical protein